MSTRQCLSTIIKRCFSTGYCLYKDTMNLFVPMESVKGMTILNRDAFKTVIELPFLKYRDVNINRLKRVLKKYYFKTKKFKPVEVTNNEYVIYLNPELIKRFEDFLDDEKKLLEGYEDFGIAKVTLNYDNWSTCDILKAILPEGIEIPSSFSSIGHIVHLNLRDEHLPYKNIIGEIYLDKISNARTVVNKTNIIDTTFRQFTMEILAGDKDTIATVKENGLTYQLDFARVYWNSRLGTEHSNLITFMKANDVLYDVFAGVGPFAVPAARKGVKVFANDLNPESYKWLETNIQINKVQSNVESFNMDGREFLNSVVKTDILNRRISNKEGSEHIAMNLPALAVEFLDVFLDWYDSDEIEQICRRPPIVHLYCFVKTSKNEDARKLGQLLVEEKLGCTLNSDSIINIHNVRHVAPNKEMIRVSFLLNENMLEGEKPARKKLKIECNHNERKTDNIAEKNGEEQGNANESEEQKCIQGSNGS